MAAEKIGEKQSRSNGGVLSGDAFKEGTATANYEDNFLDIGFMPEQITVHNDSGTELEVKFLHQLVNDNKQYAEPESPDNSVTPSSKIDGNSSFTYRRRNHRYVALKGSGAYRVEAW